MCTLLFYFILFYFILFYFILFYFYFILYFILFNFVLFISFTTYLKHLRYLQIKFCLHTDPQTDTQIRRQTHRQIHEPGYRVAPQLKNSTLDDPEFTNESPTSYFSPSSSSHAIPSSASSSPSPPPSFTNLVFSFKSIKTKYNPGHLRDKRWQNVILPWNRCHLSVTKSCPDLLQNREFLPSGWMCEIGRKKSLSENLIYKPYSGP